MAEGYMESFRELGFGFKKPVYVGEEFESV
jgi:hypothetical protein